MLPFVGMEILKLPDEVLSVVAAQLPPYLRLTSFSLAHSRLRAAADHATKTQLSLHHTFRLVSPWASEEPLLSEDEWDGEDDPRQRRPDRRRKCCNSFAQHWLPQHGQQLTRLHLTNFNMELSHLPPALKELELHGCTALWHGPKYARSSKWSPQHHDYDYYKTTISPNDMARELTALTKLHMGLCSCYAHALEPVTALTSLQHFSFTKPDLWSESCRGVGTEPPALHPHLDSMFFKTLTNLTHLELRTYDTLAGEPLLTIDGRYENAVQHLSCLVKLQTLIITTNCMTGRLAAGLQGLSNTTALTYLHLGSSTVSVDSTQGMAAYYTTPWLESLTALQWLHLERLRIEPCQLHGLSQLAGLTLDGVSFEPADLLGMLGNLTRLQQLCISQNEEYVLGRTEVVWPAPSAAYAGLTASSQLRAIVLNHGSLPVGVWPHVFPAGRLLPELRSLHAYCQQVAVGAEFRVAGQRVGPGLGSITAACPNLERLSV